MIGIVGAGAFGTALAVTLGREGREVRLLARDETAAKTIQASRCNERRLPGVALPKTVSVASDIGSLALADAVLLPLPLRGRWVAAVRPMRTGWPSRPCWWLR